MADHKQHAIDLHSEEAGTFAERYRMLAADPYRSTFTYGRKKIEAVIDHCLAGRSGRALDVGCGTGFNLARLTQKGFSVVGLEPAAGMREEARRHNPGCEIVDGDAEHLPFANASFDLVLAIEVIRYLADPLRALQEMARVTAPGCLAIVTAAPLLSLNGYAVINQVTSRLRVPTFT